MIVTASALRELHRIHKQLSDLNGRLEQGPRLMRTAEAVVKSCAASLEEANEVLKRARMASDDKQLQLKEREGRIESLKTKLNTAASNREFQALKEQIAADEQANSVLSDEILESLEKLDELTAASATCETQANAAKAEMDKTSERVQQSQQGLRDERDRVQEELAQAESALPSDIRADYERVARARGEEALAQVDGETCGACYTTLTPNSLAKMKLQQPVFCLTCGALLYLAEDTSVGGSEA